MIHRYFSATSNNLTLKHAQHPPPPTIRPYGSDRLIPATSRPPTAALDPPPIKGDPPTSLTNNVRSGPEPTRRRLAHNTQHNAPTHAVSPSIIFGEFPLSREQRSRGQATTTLCSISPACTTLNAV
ncbi:hypothetical protein IQ06DRAFT_295083 [Phaeosphaeriaceae sp. SRC1lsM3a]|nr:hypothetical protein IQ06DRAFT_295083 [Stagonospora sp. SRC1lsM3a]